MTDCQELAGRNHSIARNGKEPLFQEPYHAQRPPRPLRDPLPGSGLLLSHARPRRMSDTNIQEPPCPNELIPLS